MKGFGKGGGRRGGPPAEERKFDFRRGGFIIAVLSQLLYCSCSLFKLYYGQPEWERAYYRSLSPYRFLENVLKIEKKEGMQ